MSDDPWCRSFVGEDCLTTYGPRLTPERTEREVAGIIRLFDLLPGSSILDLACGHGRHAIALARRGYRVTGQDLSETFLERARFVRYWGEGHILNSPANIRDLWVRIFAWFAEWAHGSSGASRT